MPQQTYEQTMTVFMCIGMPIMLVWIGTAIRMADNRVEKVKKEYKDKLDRL